MIFSIFIVIFFLFANLLIPLFLYHRRFGLGKRKYKGKGGCNGWSIVMDGIAAGIINFVAAKYLLEIKASLLPRDLIVSLLIGILITFLAHAWMSYRKWEIWITPKPWRWNEGGYWHMISMTLQMAFLAYPLILLWKSHNLGFLFEIRDWFLWGVLGVVIFLWSFKRSERDLKIGRFVIKSSAW
jgi:hypothetical protein